jgi:hypothetical protein
MSCSVSANTRRHHGSSTDSRHAVTAKRAPGPLSTRLPIDRVGRAGMPTAIVCCGMSLATAHHPRRSSTRRSSCRVASSRRYRAARTHQQHSYRRTSRSARYAQTPRPRNRARRPHVLMIAPRPTTLSGLTTASAMITAPSSTPSSPRNCICVRIAKCAGFADLARVGECLRPAPESHGDSRVVAVFGGALLAGRPVTIYGDGCP